jgi:hypothetical protein
MSASVVDTRGSSTVAHGLTSAEWRLTAKGADPMKHADVIAHALGRAALAALGRHEVLDVIGGEAVDRAIAEVRRRGAPAAPTGSP